VKKLRSLTIPQERPFQAGYLDLCPYCHTKAMAIILHNWIQKQGMKRVSVGKCMLHGVILM